MAPKTPAQVFAEHNAQNVPSRRGNGELKTEAPSSPDQFCECTVCAGYLASQKAPAKTQPPTPPAA